MAGVRHSVARRKLCVNMGDERCQWSGGKGVRDSVGKCGGICHMNEREFNWQLRTPGDLLSCISM